jgi:hypothetical protein
MARVLVGTEDGLHAFGPDGSLAEVHHRGQAVTALAPEGWVDVWAVLDGREVWRTVPRGWARVQALQDLRANCVADTRAGVLVGASEARLFRVVGERLEPVEAFDRVEGRSSWYTPWGGPPDVRSISEDEDTVYVNVHVGGIVRSVDGGVTWEPTLDIDLDVHRVWAMVGGGVLAACAEGLAVSEDKGRSWTVRAEGLHARYCRAVAVAGDTVLLSASEGPRGGRAALYRAPVDGGPFERCREGLPEWFVGNVDSPCLDALPELAAFGTEDGRVFASTDGGATWRSLASGLPRVRCLLVLP